MLGAFYAQRINRYVKTGEPSRRDGRGPINPLRSGKHNLVGAESLDEIMGTQTNPALRGRQSKIRAHRTPHPGVHAGILRPTAFVQPGEDHHIVALQTGFKGAQNRQPRMGTKSRTHHTSGQQGFK